MKTHAQVPAGKSAREPRLFLAIFPILFLAIAMVVLGLLTWSVWTSYWDFRLMRGHAAQFSSYRSQLSEIDQFLVTYARLGAKTDNVRRWDEEYMKLMLERDEVVSRMRKIAPQMFVGDDALGLDKAKSTMLNQEAKALDLIRQGKPELAEGLLFGDLYEAQKKSYADKFEKITGDLQNDLKSRIAAQKKSVRSGVYLGIVSLPAFALLHFLLVYIIKRVYASQHRVIAEAQQNPFDFLSFRSRVPKRIRNL